MTPKAAFVPQDDWADPRHQRGLQGERLALAYLVSCGWSVEAHRFRLGRWDIDLILRRGTDVIFVEVKTRGSAVCGSPLEAVGRMKRERLGRVASLWSLRFGRSGDSYRFDLVAVHVAKGREPRIEHVPDAWRLGEWRGR